MVSNSAYAPGLVQLRVALDGLVLQKLRKIRFGQHPEQCVLTKDLLESLVLHSQIAHLPFHRRNLPPPCATVSSPRRESSPALPLASPHVTFGPNLGANRVFV